MNETEIKVGDLVKVVPFNQATEELGVGLVIECSDSPDRLFNVTVFWSTGRTQNWSRHTLVKVNSSPISC